MKRNRGLTLAELLVGVLALGLGLWFLAAALGRAPEESHRDRCRNNLNQLAKGMATYLNECGNNVFYPWLAGRPGCTARPGWAGLWSRYTPSAGGPAAAAKPDFGGAEWLASLYWTRIIPDPGVYLCPKTRDDNGGGTLLGSMGTPGGRPLAEEAVSYAAFGHNSVGIHLASKQGKGGAYANSALPIKDDFPPNEPMASDDTEGGINHGSRRNGGVRILFFDSHVEYWTHERVDLETGVGQGDLCALRN